MTASIKVSGRAEFNQIKREIKDLDSNLKSLQNTAKRGISQGFITTPQVKETQFLMKQMEESQKRINQLLVTEKVKFMEIRQKYKEASGERKNQLQEELKQRKEILRTYELEIDSIRKRTRHLQQDISDTTVSDPTAGGTAGSLAVGGLLKSASKVAAPLLAIGGVSMSWQSIAQGYQGAIQREKMISDLAMRIGGTRPDFEGLRRNIRDTGLRYGYTAPESMEMVDIYTSRAGALGAGDQATLQAFSRAFGLQSTQVAGTMAEMRRTGAFGAGEQKQFADMIAKSVTESRMQERAVEAMESTAMLMGDLAKTLPEVQAEGVVALQTLLNKTGVEGFRGERGADFLRQLNTMMGSQDQATETFILRALGWGTGKSYYEAMLAKEQGIFNTENLTNILGQVKKIGSTEMQDIFLTELTGISLTQAKRFREETMGYTAITEGALKAIQGEITSEKDVVDNYAKMWGESLGGWVTTVDSKLEEALSTFSRGLINDLTLAKEKMVEVADAFVDRLNIDMWGKGEGGVFGEEGNTYGTPVTLGAGALTAGATVAAGFGLKSFLSKILGKGTTTTAVKVAKGAGIGTAIKGAGTKLASTLPGLLGGAVSTVLPALLPALPVIGPVAYDVATREGALDEILDPWKAIFGDKGAKIRQTERAIKRSETTLSFTGLPEERRKKEEEELRKLKEKHAQLMKEQNESVKGHHTEIQQHVKDSKTSIESFSTFGKGILEKIGTSVINLSNLTGLTGTAGAYNNILGGGNYNPFSGYRITSSFGYRGNIGVPGATAFHHGVDYAVPRGTPVSSVGSGVVKRAGYSNSFGYYVEKLLDTGETVRYGHLDKLNVKAGDIVEKGQVLGLSGNTGISSGAHLHFDIRDAQGNWVDPQKWFAQQANVSPGEMTAKGTEGTLNLNLNVTGNVDAVQESKLRKIISDVVNEANLRKLFSATTTR